MCLSILAAAGVRVLSGQASANPQDCQILTGQYAAAKPGEAGPNLNNYVFRAADKGCVELLRTLLADGGSVSERRSAGETALHHAAAAGDVEVARLLLDNAADINQRDLKGSTALFAAVEANHVPMVRFLLSRHADAAIIGRSDVTPLSAAAFNGNEAVVAALLAAGVDVKPADGTGKSAILYAVNRGFVKIAAQLLASGVDVNASFGHDLTALMWAAGYADDVPEADGVATVALLLDNGAKPDAVDDRGYSALMTAAGLGHEAVVKLLTARGASTAITGKDGKTAADLAASDATKAALAGK